MAAKRGRVFIFDPVMFDQFVSPTGIEKGTKVVKTQPFGCPKNGTMGMTYVQDAETGKFYGLVMQNSLTPTRETAVVRDLAKEARDKRDAERYAAMDARQAARMAGRRA